MLDVALDRTQATVHAKPSWYVSRSRGQLRIAYGTVHHAPQYAALHLRDSYLRLNYGPDAGWGTSVILLPIYWSDGVCHHGGRVQASWRVDGHALTLDLRGRIGGLRVSLHATLAPPKATRIVATVYVECSGDASLDARPGEAFKPVMLSSMRVSSTHWDALSAHVDGRPLSLPRGGWIHRDPRQRARTFGLLGGTSLWKRNAPTVHVELDEPLPVSGWVTHSEDPNDDNVGLWAASDHVLRRWRYRITAASPHVAYNT